MRLREIVEQRRTEAPSNSTAPSAHACFAVRADAAVLDVTASDGVEWQFPWQQFTSARHGKEGELDSSVLTFTTHVVTVRGYHFAALREAIRESRLALLRAAPAKYAKTAYCELFVTALHVKAIEE